MSRVLRIADDGQEHAESAVTESAGAADAGRIPALASDGKLDASMLRAVGTAVTSFVGRTGTVVAMLNDYAASLIGNDSGVVGSTVKAALDTLSSAISSLAGVSYVTVGTTAALPNERALAAGAGVGFIDGGAGGALTINNVHVPITIAGPLYTLVLSDAGRQLLTGGFMTTITVPPVATVPFPSGTVIVIMQNETASPTIVGDTNVTVRFPPGKSSTLAGLYSVVVLKKTSSADYWSATGDLADLTSYLTLGAATYLANERVLTMGEGLGVVDAGAGGSYTITPRTLATSSGSAAYTLALADAWDQLLMSNAGAINVTIPDNATVPFLLGTEVHVTQAGTGQVSFDIPTGVVLQGSNGTQYIGPLTGIAPLIGRNGTARLLKSGTNTWYISGNIARTVFAGGSFTVTSQYADYIVNCVGTSTVTLNAQTTTPFPIGGSVRVIKGFASGSVTFVAGAGATVNVAPGFAATMSNQYVEALVTKTAVDTWLVSGEGLDDSTSYLTLGTTGALPNERVLTQGPGLAFTDGGAGSTLTLSATGQLALNSPSGTAYTLVLADAGKNLNFNNPSPVTVNVPTNLAVPFLPGTQIQLSGTGVGIVSVAAAGGVSLVTPQGRVASITGYYGVAHLLYFGGDTWIIYGDLTDTTTHLTLSATARFPNERVLTPGSNVSFVDGGAGGALTINAALNAPSDVAAFAAYELSQVLTSSSGTNTLLSAVTEHLDQNGAFSAGLYTVPTTGVYVATCTGRLMGSAGPNGLLILAYPGFFLSQPWAPDSTGTSTSNISFTFNAVVGTTISFYARQDSGANRTITGLIQIHRLGGTVPISLYKAGGRITSAAIPNSAETALVLTESYDPNNNLTTTAYTVPLTGAYHVGLQLEGNFATTGFLRARILRNGSTTLDTPTGYGFGVPAGYVHVAISEIVSLTVGDVLTVSAFHDSGAARSVGGRFFFHLMST